MKQPQIIEESNLTAGSKTNKSQDAREYKAANPKATIKQIAEAIGATKRAVSQALRREKERASKGRGLTFGGIAYTPESESICSYRIDSDVRSFLIKTYGESHGIFACLILSQDSTDRPSLSRFLLSGCHPSSRKRILLGKAPTDNYSASYLASFQREMPFYVEISPASEGKRSRQCLEFSFPENVWKRISSIAKKGTGDIVNVFTGKASKTFPAVILAEDPAIEEIQVRLNKQDLDYSSLIEGRSYHIEKALDALQNDAARYLQRSMYGKILCSPKPSYSAKGKTVRLYALGSSLMSLCRSARKEVFDGFLQFDLKHAQISIVAKIWEAEDIRERLKSGNLWSEMESNTGLKKDLLKKILYTVIFGGSLSQAIFEASKELGEEYSYHETSARVLKDPLFTRLYSASEMQTKKLKESQTCIDAFNHERLVPSPKKCGRQKKVRTDPDRLYAEDYRSAKACQAQSYEMAIMIPMVKYLLDKKVPIWLFLHDGIILPPGNEEHFDECRRIVKEKAAEFGIDIDLTMETIRGVSLEAAPQVAKNEDGA